MRSEEESVVEEVIGHLMEAQRLLDTLSSSPLRREAVEPIARVAATLRAHSYLIRSARSGERWPPTPEVSG